MSAYRLRCESLSAITKTNPWQDYNILNQGTYTERDAHVGFYWTNSVHGPPFTGDEKPAVLTPVAGRSVEAQGALAVVVAVDDGYHAEITMNSETRPQVLGVSVDDRLGLGAVGAGVAGRRDGLKGLTGVCAISLHEPAESYFPLARAASLGEVLRGERGVNVAVLASLLGDGRPPRVVVVDDHGDGLLREGPPLGKGGLLGSHSQSPLVYQ